MKNRTTMIDTNKLSKEEKLSVLTLKYSFMDTSTDGILKALPGLIRRDGLMFTLILNKSPDGMMWSAAYSLLSSETLDGIVPVNVLQDLAWSRGIDLQSALASLYIIIKENNFV